MVVYVDTPHHSSGTWPSKYDTRVVEDAQYCAVRGQTTATRAGGPSTQYFTFDDEDVPAPQERVLQRIEVYVDAPSLDVPALQWDEEANAFLLAPALACSCRKFPQFLLPLR